VEAAAQILIHIVSQKGNRFGRYYAIVYQYLGQDKIYMFSEITLDTIYMNLY